MKRRGLASQQAALLLIALIIIVLLIIIIMKVPNLWKGIESMFEKLLKEKH